MTAKAIVQTIRRALNADERSGRDIAKAAGIHHVNLSQFKTGDRELPLKSLALLAGVLGLEIAVIEKKKKS